MRKLSPHLLTALALLLPVWLFGPYLFSAAVFKEVAPLHFDYAEKKWFFDGIAQGHWNFLYPFNELGHGLLNNPASGLMFLPNFLHALLPFAVASKILFYAHCLIFFFGMRALLRLYCGELAAGGVALVALGSGLLTSLPVHVALGYASFFPWTIYFVVCLWRREDSFLEASFCSSALFLLGDPFLIPAAWLLGTLLGYRTENKRQFFAQTLYCTLLICCMCSPHIVMMLLNAPFNSRALGIDPFEALSYSTAPIRILDWLFPSFDLYSPKDFLGRGFHLQWWFPRIGGGVVLTGLIIWGIVGAEKRTVRVLFGWSLFFLLLSLGQFFAPSAFLFEHAPILKFIRYPERFLLYLFPAVLILAGLGLARLPRKLALLALILCLAENIASPRRSELVLPADLPHIPKRSWVQGDFHQARYLVCETGLDGKNAYQYFDLRAQQIAMVNGTSNSRSAALKAVSCPWALSDYALKWLGVTHVLSSGDAHQWPSHLQVVAKLPQGHIFHNSTASPRRALGVRNFAVGEFVSSLPLSPDDVSRITSFTTSGALYVSPIWSVKDGWSAKNKGVPAHPWQCHQDFVTMNPGRDYQSFVLRIPAGCTGLLNLPWAFQAGWQSDVQGGTFFRINDATLGLEIPSGTAEINLTYRPPGGTALAVFSILLQAFILGTILFRLFRRT